MKTRQTVTLLVIAAVVALAAWWYGEYANKVTEEAAAKTKEISGGLTSATVERIEIFPAEGTSVTLSKRDGKWYTNPDKDYRVDKNAIRTLFDVVQKELKGDVVATNAENYSEYQVNDTSATRVQIFGNGKDPVKDLYVGKTGPGSSTYVREADSPEVVLVNAALTYALNRPEGWRDKSIFDVPQSQVIGVSAEGTSATWSLKKENGKWTVQSPPAREPQILKLNSVIATAASLRAAEFVDRQSTEPLSDFGLDPPLNKFTLIHEDKNIPPPSDVTQILLIGKKRDNGYYVKRADTDHIYSIMDYQVNSLLPSVEELTAPQSAGIQAAKAAQSAAGEGGTTATATGGTTESATATGRTTESATTATAGSAQPAAATQSPAATASPVAETSSDAATTTGAAPTSQAAITTETSGTTHTK